MKFNNILKYSIIFGLIFAVTTAAFARTKIEMSIVVPPFDPTPEVEPCVYDPCIEDVRIRGREALFPFLREYERRYFLPLLCKYKDADFLRLGGSASGQSGVYKGKRAGYKRFKAFFGDVTTGNVIETHLIWPQCAKYCEEPGTVANVYELKDDGKPYVVNTTDIRKEDIDETEEFYDDACRVGRYYFANVNIEDRSRRRFLVYDYETEKFVGEINTVAF